MRPSLLFFTLFLVLASCSTRSEAAKTNSDDKVIAGWVEEVCFPGIEQAIKAKLDTGAKTSSIYAENIQRFEKNNERWVRFNLALKDKNQKVHKLKLEKPLSRRVKIKNHDGNHDSRVTVNIPMSFNGQTEEVEFSLVDRSEYIYPVLLGRRFLSQYVLVDASSTFLTSSSCGK
ncbi:ATP-dependent zinc protease [Agaribacterium sp. ZY112]|uniref:ATP-dependent zinc protease family protein n=1 Tax=Agaribacterium sp. ZY112 TaxID=3233574 RepID=UPI0035261637